MVFISVCYHVTICNDLRSVKVFKNAYHLLTFIPEYPCLLSSSILRSTVKKTSKSKFLMQIKTFFSQRKFSEKYRNKRHITNQDAP